MNHFEFYVAPNGSDEWTGRLPAPNAAATDGPFATVGRARDAVRGFNLSSQPGAEATVWLREGLYRRVKPLVFGPEDSGPVTYSAYPGERPVIDGGQRIEDWRVEHRDGREVWIANLPDVTRGAWYFRQLWVNGKRRPRARLPKAQPGKANFFRVKDVPAKPSPDAPEHGLFEGTDAFESIEGEIQDWPHLTEAEIVLLHLWVEERMPVAAFDETTRTVRSSHRSLFRILAGEKFYIDNLFEALTEPGEWFLDKTSSRLHYLPFPGETPECTEVIAPCALQLLKIEGTEEHPVEGLRFRGLTFQHTDWQPSQFPHDAGVADYLSTEISYASGPQSACQIPGALSMKHARGCALEDCTLQHLGWYGIELGAGCLKIDLVGNELQDLGAGGIRIGGGDAAAATAQHTGRNVITDNHIHHVGRVFHSGAGIFLQHSFGNAVMHNHIHDLHYTGISCGWVWGYGESISRDNRIEKNHIHHLGHDWLSDQGGIYTLGVQPGTTIRGNLIHDIGMAEYGGWAIYPDEGSSDLLIENNICYNIDTPPFSQHYGRDNNVRNNIFCGRGSLVSLTRGEDHRAFTVERNILVSSGEPIFCDGPLADLANQHFASDSNLLWSTMGPPKPAPGKDLAAWRELGYDENSIIADPHFQALENFDFTLAENSPALALGFQPIDTSDVGPRRRDTRHQVKEPIRG